MVKEKFIVLDVEGASNKRPYNIGFIVADRYGRIYKRYSFAFPENIWENIVNAVETGICLEMTKTNIQEILSDFQHTYFKRKYKQISIDDFYKTFTRVIKRYKIKRLFAYNVSYDKSALNRLFGEDRFQSLDLQYCDIISGILTSRLMTNKYCNFCITNNFITDKKHIMTKAEIVYKFITGNLQFVEEHTGLSDVGIEYEILLSAFNSHKKLNFEPCCAWRKLEKYCKEHNIVIP